MVPLLGIFLFFFLFFVLLCILFFLKLKKYLFKKNLTPIEGRDQPSQIQIENDRVCIHGIRYCKPDGLPFVLFHGYTGNSRHWREVGGQLFQRGFDVWMPNLRGHGLGAHRSFAKTEDSGAYSFEKIVLEDIPLIVDHVLKETHQKPVVVGHSMGGMALKAYLSGVCVRKGEPVFDSEQALILSESKVKSLVTIGSPPHFHSFPKVIRWATKMLPEMSARIQSSARIPSTNREPTAPDRNGWRDRLRRKVLDRVDRELKTRKIFTQNILKGVVNPDNFASGELKALLEKGISGVHRDLARDANAWAKEGEARTLNGVSLSQKHPIHVPFLICAGEFDSIANASEVLADAQEWMNYARVWPALIKKTSHVDLICGERAARLLAPVLEEFSRDPFHLGNPGQVFEITEG